MCVGCGGYACANDGEGDHSAQFAKKQTEKGGERDKRKKERKEKEDKK